MSKEIGDTKGIANPGKDSFSILSDDINSLGIANIPNQVYRIAMKHGVSLNLLFAGMKLGVLNLPHTRPGKCGQKVIPPIPSWSGN